MHPQTTPLVQTSLSHFTDYAPIVLLWSVTGFSRNSAASLDWWAYLSLGRTAEGTFYAKHLMRWQPFPFLWYQVPSQGVWPSGVIHFYLRFASVLFMYLLMTSSYERTNVHDYSYILITCYVFTPFCGVCTCKICFWSVCTIFLITLHDLYLDHSSLIPPHMYSKNTRHFDQI